MDPSIKSSLQQQKMRRQGKEIPGKPEMEEIIKNSLVCRLGMCKDNVPYIVPVSFGYDGKCLYIHTAPEGRKIDFWTKNSLVCFEFDIDVQTIGHEEKACKWSASFQSVMGYGIISEIIDRAIKMDALNQIMLHYSNKKWEFNDKDLVALKVWQVKIMEMTGKKS